MSHGVVWHRKPRIFGLALFLGTSMISHTPSFQGQREWRLALIAAVSLHATETSRRTDLE